MRLKYKVFYYIVNRINIFYKRKNMNKFILGVIFLVSALFSADSFTFKKANNTKEVMSNLQKSHSKQGLKAKQYSKVRAYKVFYVSDFVFDSNTDELTGIYNGGQLLFYLAYNKVQGDPTIFLSKNILQNYGCDYIAQQVS